MTNPTGNERNNVPRLRLTLDNGELLEVDGSTVDDSGVPTVVLRLTPWRAHDLAHVLDTYTRLVEVMSRSSEVSGTEESLSRALLDAVSLLRPTNGPESLSLGKVTSGRRAMAMAVLQEHRPDLDHTALIAGRPGGRWDFSPGSPGLRRVRGGRPRTAAKRGPQSRAAGARGRRPRLTKKREFSPWAGSPCRKSCAPLSTAKLRSPLVAN